MSQRPKASPYMEWAKLHSKARFNLATSGVTDYPLRDLPVTIEDLEITGPSTYGWPPLEEALARHAGVGVDEVVPATGASLANHLAMAAILEPGDEVLVEEPVYDPLLRAAQYLGADVRRLPRRDTLGFRLEAREVERTLTPRTRLVVITNFHNPSGAPVDEPTLRAVGAAAKSVGARVLVDEVYLECLYPPRPPYAARLGPEFVTTSSLTKAYGLSGLRCGFILAEPELARRMHRLHDLFGSVHAHAAERLSLIALANLDGIAARARALVATNRALLRAALLGRPELELEISEHGTTAFPRLRNGQVDALCALLRDRYETSVVPGRFFERPDRFRVGIGGPTEPLREGLARLGRALEEVGRG